MMGVLTRPIWKTSTCLMQPSAALPCPDHVASLDEVGLKVGGQRLEPDRVVVVVAWHGVAWRRAGRVVPPLRVAGRASRVRGASVGARAAALDGMT
jgi:hypothetical protein